MKQSDLDKILRKHNMISFPDNLSKQILESFKPQLKLMESFRRQIEEANKNLKSFKANFSQPFLNSIQRQMEMLNKNTSMFVEKNHSALENISKNLKPIQNSITSQSLAITNTFTRQIMPQLYDFEKISRNLITSQQLAAKNFSDIISHDLANVQNMIRQIDFSRITEQINYLRDAQFQLNFGHNVV